MCGSGSKLSSTWQKMCMKAAFPPPNTTTNLPHLMLLLGGKKRRKQRAESGCVGLVSAWLPVLNCTSPSSNDCPPIPLLKSCSAWLYVCCHCAKLECRVLICPEDLSRACGRNGTGCRPVSARNPKGLQMLAPAAGSAGLSVS